MGSNAVIGIEFDEMKPFPIAIPMPNPYITPFRLLNPIVMLAHEPKGSCDRPRGSRGSPPRHVLAGYKKDKGRIHAFRLLVYKKS